MQFGSGGPRIECVFLFPACNSPKTRKPQMQGAGMRGSRLCVLDVTRWALVNWWILEHRGRSWPAFEKQWQLHRQNIEAHIALSPQVKGARSGPLPVAREGSGPRRAIAGVSEDYLSRCDAFLRSLPASEPMAPAPTHVEELTDPARYVCEATPAMVRRDLIAAVESYGVRTLRQHYEAWERERVRRFFVRREPTYKDPGVPFPMDPARARAIAKRLGIARAAPVVIAELGTAPVPSVARIRWLHFTQLRHAIEARMPRVRRLLTDLRLWATARGHSPARILLAEVRVLEPLLETFESDFAELAADELARLDQAGNLDVKDVEKFLERAIANERLLLTRKAGLARYQELHDLVLDEEFFDRIAMRDRRSRRARRPARPRGNARKRKRAARKR